MQRAKLSLLIAYLLETSKMQQEIFFKYAYLITSINQVRNIQWSPKSLTLLMWPSCASFFSLASHLQFPAVSLYARHSEWAPVPWGAKFSLTSRPSQTLLVCLELSPLPPYSLAPPHLTFRPLFKPCSFSKLFLVSRSEFVFGGQNIMYFYYLNI